MEDVEDFIYQFEGNQRDIMLYFHKLLTLELNLIDKIKFGIPFYYRKSWICYLNPIKNTKKVEFAFLRGNELSNIQGVLMSKGRKQVYSIEFEEITKIPIPLINEIIQEAIILDDIKPYAPKRRIRRKSNIGE